MNKTILVVAAHPDDEVLGCGGVMARYSSLGDKVCVLILGEGITSRNSYTNSDKENLYRNAKEANKLLGVEKLFIKSLPDNRFDSIDFLDIVSIIEQYKLMLMPDIIFTHFQDDLNIDHRITFQAVLTATRPMQNECVKEVYSFEVLSSTEWSSVKFSQRIHT